MKEAYYRIKRGFKNLKIYYSFIWNLRPWGAKHIYETMRFQLTQMIYNDIESLSEQEMDNILRCIDILKNRIDDNYIGIIYRDDPKPFLLFDTADLSVKEVRTANQKAIDEESQRMADALRDSEWKEFSKIFPKIK